MNKQENKRLVKFLTERKKELKNEDVSLDNAEFVKLARDYVKYVTKDDYKELLILNELMKDNLKMKVYEVENLIKENRSKFPFLYKCLQSISNFILELRCNGPYCVVKEMIMQGKDKEYANKIFLN